MKLPEQRSMVNYTIPCKGIVAYSQHDWNWEELLTREPREDEFLVEMIATGVCHTDISGYGGIYPRVLGHEGTSPQFQMLTSWLPYCINIYIPLSNRV